MKNLATIFEHQHGFNPVVLMSQVKVLHLASLRHVVTEPDFVLQQRRLGFVTEKEFVVSEAQRLGLTLQAIYCRISRGSYSGLEYHKLNERVIFVRHNGPLPAKPQHISAADRTKAWRAANLAKGLTVNGKVRTRYFTNGAGASGGS